MREELTLLSWILIFVFVYIYASFCAYVTYLHMLSAKGLERTEAPLAFIKFPIAYDIVSFVLFWTITLLSYRYAEPKYLAILPFLVRLFFVPLKARKLYTKTFNEHTEILTKMAKEQHMSHEAIQYNLKAMKDLYFDESKAKIKQEHKNENNNEKSSFIWWWVIYIIFALLALAG